MSGRAAVKAIGDLTLGRRERFHHRVVVAIPTTTHRARHAVRIEPPLVVLARVRAALIGGGPAAVTIVPVLAVVR